MQANESVEPAAAAQTVAEEQEKRAEAKRERLQKMREYAESAACRRALLLRYLGDEFEGNCGHCDNCEAASLGVDPKLGTRREVV